MSDTARGVAGRFVRPTALAVALTGAVTLTAALPGRLSPVIAAVLYVLAVTAASAASGLTSGLAASVLAFLALNFFFTPPFHTLAVERTEDLVALGVFLVISVIVGMLLSRAVRQRARAERRERETRLLHHLATRLLSGEPLPDVLARFATAITELLGLIRCEITTELGGKTIRVGADGSPSGTPEVVPMVARGTEVGRVVAFPPAGRTLDGEERHVLRTFAGQMGLAVEGSRLAAEADEARLAAETSHLRAALFSSVTHDLRTPLASITAAVTTLKSSPRLNSDDRTELLDTIHHEADRLNRLVGNLMDLSRIRAGALVPERVRADVGEVIEGVVARLRSVLEHHAVRMVLRDDLPALPMDVVQIDQVLTNLLENAARFSPRGTEIAIYATRWQGYVEVRVSDRGPGIPRSERARVLEPFIRGEEGGTGLGLSIALAIVESHGGRMRITDTPGGGTTVAFRLPVE